ncbi:MAG: xanthine dehydrogenase family protein molybdopterin-binding subunit [Dehalococcoidia bacterium]|nr:xanthine dehydrogenase family protein molybdopterin-binding subunit [Dehalococcoidia bacterium]
MVEYSILGTRMPRDESAPKATGEGKFSADFDLPHMLHAKLLISPFAHARISNIDTSRAMNLRGVKAVLTGKDIPPIKMLPGLGPDLPTDQYIFAIDRVCYLGDAVAAVAAVDEDTAEEALELIKVDYEPLPAVLDLEEAIRPGAVRIHDHAEQNIAARSLLEYGDVEAGFRESDYIREDTFKYQLIAYCLPEPQSALADYDPMSGKLTLWASTQSAYAIRRRLAHILDIPWTRLRVIAPYVGGGYGARGFLHPVFFSAAALAKSCGRPVKCVNTREQEFMLLRLARHQAVVTVRTGVKKDGTLMAREATALYDCGAYKGAIEGPVPQSYVAFLHVPYKIPNVRIEGISAYTNKQPIGAFRGNGQYQPLWSSDLQMDLIAKDLGLDRMGIRLKNAVQADSVTPLDWRIRSCGLEECVRNVSKAIDWKENDPSLEPGRGKGLSASIFPCIDGGSPEVPLEARVKINADGSAVLVIIGTDSGSGQYSTLVMIVAEELGIPYQDVKREVGDSDLFPHNQGGIAVTISTFGRSVQMATVRARQAIFEVVADKLEANVQDLEARDGRVHVKGSPDRGMSFAEAARMTVAAKGPIVGHGESYQEAYKRGNQYVKDRYMQFSHPGPAEGFSFGAGAAEVEVDIETGGVQLLRLAHGYDVGFAVNPMGVEGQLEGAAAQGVGGLLTEEVVVDGTGQIMNPSYENYGILTALDMPQTIPVIVETNDPREGPYGAKELGMGAVGASAASVINAIFDATGVMLKDFPATPEKVLGALEAKSKNQ